MNHNGLFRGRVYLNGQDVIDFAYFDEDGDLCINTEEEAESDENDEPEADYVASFSNEDIEANAYPYNFEGNRVAFDIVEQTNSILIDVPNSNLRIEESADSELNFSVEGVEDLSSCDISAFYNGEYQYFGFRHRQNMEEELPLVTLQIPSSISKSIGILMKMGDCEVQNVHCDLLAVQSESGDVELTLCPNQAAHLDASSQCGDIEIVLKGCRSKLDSRSEVGDVSDSGGEEGPKITGEVRTGSGDILIR